MLLLRVIVTLVACWIVECDLLDLYVQHMDETMRTRLYSNRRYPMNPISRRIKRSLVSPLDNAQNIDKRPFDENRWWHIKKKKRIVPYENDALDYPNKREENTDPEQHEMLSKQPEETSTTAENVAEADTSFDIETSMSTFEDELESNSTQASTIEEQIGARDRVSLATDIEELDLEGRFAEGDWEDLDDTENGDENLPYEIIGEHNRRNYPEPFDDPSFKRTPKPRGNRVPKKYLPSLEKPYKVAREAKSHIGHEAATRFRRSSMKNVSRRGVDGKRARFIRYEKLDENNDVILEWDPTNDEKVTFRITARTLGYVGIGFNDKSHMKGADIVLAWVDDHTGTVNVLDSHGVENSAPVTDTFQDVQVLSGSQNETHTTVTFSRNWKTCDPQDYQLSGDSVRVLWALHQTDPELNVAIWHGPKRGAKALRLKAAAAHAPSMDIRDTRQWDVRLNQFKVENEDTIYWCKLYTASLPRTHHMIGYVPLVTKANEDLVHHITLYQCVSAFLSKHVKLAGGHCSRTPLEWKSCTIPILAWARGSEGEWLPEHVGIPIAEYGMDTYYMLEIHYNNPTRKTVFDSSGVRLYLTSKLRRQEAGILVTGVAMNPLHLIPPEQKEFATAGYCPQYCTKKMVPKDGINIISVFLHSHTAGRRLSLKHLRQGKELPKIVQDNHFDFDYQQSHTLAQEVKVLPGDELITECVYCTSNRTQPTYAGYTASQEMCLAFVMYYPKTSLAACYSMISARGFFKAFGVYGLWGAEIITMDDLFTEEETGGDPNRSSHKENNEIDGIFTVLITEPPEFRNRTLAEHILALPWKDELLASSIQKNLYYSDHITFCRKTNDQLLMPPSIQPFPNYTFPETNDTSCSEWKNVSGSTGIRCTFAIDLIALIAVSIIAL